MAHCKNCPKFKLVGWELGYCTQYLTAVEPNAPKAAICHLNLDGELLGHTMQIRNFKLMCIKSSPNNATYELFDDAQEIPPCVVYLDQTGIWHYRQHTFKDPYKLVNFFLDHRRHCRHFDAFSSGADNNFLVGQ